MILKASVPVACRSHWENALQAFICHQEGKLQPIDTMKDHNSTADYLHSLAHGYNPQLRVFKETQARRQRDIIRALMLMAGTSQR